MSLLDTSWRSALHLVKSVVLLLLVLSSRSASAENTPLTIVIDPGHGGDQFGARAPNKVWEKELTLLISKKLAQKVRNELHAQALLTRQIDEPVFLNKRPEFANSHSADLFISVHLNSMPTRHERETISGIETFFLSANASNTNAARVAALENAADGPVHAHGHDDVSAILDDLAISAAHQDSSRLAYAIHQKLVGELGAIDRGVQQAPFAVLNGASMPAVLVEVGFISHPVEGLKLCTDAYQEQIATALLDGIKAFLEQNDHAQHAAATTAVAAPKQIEAVPASH
jgi:N-acetylmuramoyl-L-alanine amidase